MLTLYGRRNLESRPKKLDFSAFDAASSRRMVAGSRLTVDRCGPAGDSAFTLSSASSRLWSPEEEGLR